MVALSTTESEYMAATEAVKEALWLQELTSKLEGEETKTATIYCESQSAVCSKNQTFHERTKHIDVRYHFIRDVINEGKVNLKKIGTSENAADAFTKRLESCLKTLKIGAV